MDSCLILAAKSFWLQPENWWAMAQVLLGLGAVIFVHELGHFLVAKACGVKCEKFYLGFDVPIRLFGITLVPAKLVHWQWGETEYGIGSIPLGGYVKMLGQDDNPGNIEEENRRSELATNDVTAENLPPGYVDQTRLDPRSFKAKSVIQRMAIISAGVVFNLIFAVVFAAIAFRSGVDYAPVVFGDVTPGGPAWEEDLTGVTVKGINGKEAPGYFPYMDLVQEVAMNGDEAPMSLDIVRYGAASPETIEVTPRAGMNRAIDLPLLGVTTATTPKIAKENPTLEGNPAERADPPFMPSDTIVELNGASIATAYDLKSALARNFDKPATMVLQRDAENGNGEKVTTVVDTNPRREFGLIMKWKPVYGVQKGSPAAEAGFHKDDVIVAIDGLARGDLLTLDQRMTRIARDEKREVPFIVKRDGKEVTLNVRPRLPRVIPGIREDHPIAIDSLGLAIKLSRTVEQVISGSSAAETDITPGDELVEFQFLLNDEQKANDLFSGIKRSPLDLADGSSSWGELNMTVQQLRPGSEFKLTFKRGNDSNSYTLKTQASEDFFLLTRGIMLTQLQDHYRSASWSDAAVLGARQTWSDAGRVWRFLKKLVRGKISPKNLGGPGTIALAATSEATAGTSRLLLFLTLLSANLAIVNFLPIPVLDGGHMVMLLYEGIFRRPVTEQVQIVLAYAGLAILLALMAFVILMDAKRIFELFG